MNANPELTCRPFFRAYSDLEPKIRDLTLMAEFTRDHAANAFAPNYPGETVEEHRESEIAMFTIEVGRTSAKCRNYFAAAGYDAT